METFVANLNNAKLKASKGKTIYTGRKNYEGGIGTITILIAAITVSIVLLNIFMGG
jgi:hypothetical protein